MAKFLLLASYSPQTVAGMLEKPSDRATAVQRLAEAVGGRLVALYWMLGEHDVVIIMEAPDASALAAASVAATSAGGLTHLESHQLFETDEIADIVAKARQVRGAYVPPGR